jgi:Ca2+-binding EF-hand superfamily protein
LRRQATDEDIADCFKVLCADQKKMAWKDVPFALRALEKNPTEAELKAIEDKYKGGVSEDEFKKLVKSKESGRRPVEQDKEMREVMSVLDKDGAGFINVVELRSILQNLGDNLSEDDCRILFKEVKVDIDGMIAYDEFIDMLVTDYPLHAQGKIKFGGK